MYYVKVSKKVLKFVEKLPRNTQIRINNDFKQLKENPMIGKVLDRNKSTYLMELKYLSHRIYYTLENNQFLVINDIEYIGVVDINDVSNKNSQQRTIDKLKKRI